LNVEIPEDFQPLLESHKRFRIAIGGRGSGKSMTVAMMCIIEAVQGKRVLCCREFQNSIAESVHSLVATLISDLGVPGFSVTRDRITHDSGGEFIFRGLSRNIESVKSLHGVNVVWLEEAQTISEESLRVLTPTIREKGSYFLMCANPRSEADPFTITFLQGRFPQLRLHGTFEDELHTIVRCNYSENPYFPPELELERQRDKLMLSDAEYRHVWEGETLDEVDNSIILVDWFNAAIGLAEHVKVRPSGSRVVAHDVADSGPDAKAVVVRHGPVVLQLGLKTDGTASDGLDWAIQHCDDYSADSFIWDADGIGLGLAREVERQLGPRNIQTYQFHGGERPENPDAAYDGHRSNRDAFFNRRAQAYWYLRDRFYKSYQLSQGEFVDPDECIFLDENLPHLSQLRSEVCRIPRKPNANGKIQLMTKSEMAKPPLSLPSPNLADALAYCYSMTDDLMGGAWAMPIEYQPSMDNYI
jgi:phage terminase large subunit